MEQDKYHLLVEAVVSKLRADENVLAIALCDVGSAAVEKSIPRLDLLVLVSSMPFDLDMFGRKRVRRQNIETVLTYYRPERLRTAIEDEAGCWFASGLVLYSKTIYDPTSLFLAMRRLVNSISEDKRRVAIDSWVAAAKAYPSMVFNRMSLRRGSRLEMLLGDQAPVARALFLINSKPPRGETSLLEDLLNLPKLPPRFEDLFGIIDAFQIRDLKKFKQAQKGYATFIAEIERLAS